MLDRLRSAWQATVDNHTTLRTVFLWEGLTQPTQVVRQEEEVPFRIHDWTSAGLDIGPALDAFALQRRQEGFDLSSAPLMDIDLVIHEDGPPHLIWNFHHLVLDGWSAVMVLDEVLDRYHGNPPPAAPPFRNYVAWLQQQDHSAAAAHWQQVLKGFGTASFNQLSRSSESPLFVHQQESMALEPQTWAALSARAREFRCTPNTLVQAAWSVVQSAYSNSPDVVFGVTTSGRPADLLGVDTIAGLFLSTLPFRVNLEPERDLGAWLPDIQRQQLSLNEYQFSSLADIIRNSNLASGSAIFDTILIFENFPGSATRHGELSVQNKTVFEQTDVPLTLMAGVSETLEVLAHFDSNRFTAAQVDGMLTHLQHVLGQMTTAATVGDLLTLPHDQQKELRLWASTPAPDTVAPNTVTREIIGDLFAAQAKRSPEVVAVRDDNREITYRELEEASNQLAHLLRASGLAGGDRVVVSVPRSVDLAVVLLAVVKAGCAYVPLDAKTPKARIRQIASEAGATLTIDDVFLAAPDLGNELTASPRLRLTHKRRPVTR